MLAVTEKKKKKKENQEIEFIEKRDLKTHLDKVCKIS